MFNGNFVFFRQLDYFNPLPNKPCFLRVCSTSLSKTLWEKEKLLVTSNFSFSHQRFQHVWRTFCHFHQIKNCLLQTLSVWKSLKFVVWIKKYDFENMTDDPSIYCLTFYAVSYIILFILGQQVKYLCISRVSPRTRLGL